MISQHYLPIMLNHRQQKKSLRFVIPMMILLVIVLISTREAHAAVSYVQKTGEFAQYFGIGPPSIDIPVTAGVTSGNSVIVTLSWGAWSSTATETTTCSDSQGNSYTTDVTEFDGASLYTVICSSHNVTALTTSDTITVSFSFYIYGVAATAHEFSGLDSSPVDQTASASGSSTTPSSGNTAVTTQADELLIGAIGVSGPLTDSFTLGNGYFALDSAGFPDDGFGNGGTIRPEYKIVSATGSYQADGILNPSRSWGAAIATYKAAAPATTINLSGTLYSDEGTTPLSGQTVRLLVEGVSAGTAVTDASGNYVITATVAVGDNYVPLLVYVDDGPTVAGTTVTVLNSTASTAISDLHIYANHLIVRNDYGFAPLDIGDMRGAKEPYSDPDILYTIAWPNLQVIGNDTELYIPSGHSFTPGGNVTAPHVEILGTLTAGSNTFTISGDWDHTYGTFNQETSTVDFTGTGTIRIAGAWWTKPFYNVNAAAAGQTTTIAYGNGIDVANVLTLGSGTLAGGNVNLSLNSGTPLVSTGTIITNTQFKFHPNSGGPVNVAAAAYRDIWLAGNAATNTFNLTGDMSCATLRVYGSGPGDHSIFDTGGFAVNCTNLAIGSHVDTDRYGTFRLNSSSVNVSGNVTIYVSDNSGTNQIDAGSASINVGGDWSNNDVFVPGTSLVIFDGATQALSGFTSFHNLTKTAASADTLIFAAGSTQTVTGSATLQGSSGQLLALRSSSPGVRWNFNLAAGAGKSISHVDVQDSDASGSDSSLLEINPPLSIDSGNNVSWFGSANITAVKSSTVISDPVNGTVNPKRIPGAVVEYHILVSNTSGAQAANLIITDDLSAELANLDFEVDGYAPGKGIQVTAPNINGGTVLDLTNAADADQGDYGVTAANTVTVGGIVLDAGEQAGIRFRVIIR